MGFSEGRGLGRHEQGLTVPVAELLIQQAGRTGLGFRDAEIDEFREHLPDRWDFQADEVHPFSPLLSSFLVLFIFCLSSWFSLPSLLPPCPAPVAGGGDERWNVPPPESEILLE